MLKNALCRISDNIPAPCLMTLDFEDSETVTSEPRPAMTGIAVAGVLTPLAAIVRTARVLDHRSGSYGSPSAA